jgi:hypothetical protein
MQKITTARIKNRGNRRVYYIYSNLNCVPQNCPKSPQDVLCMLLNGGIQHEFKNNFLLRYKSE